MLRKLENLVRTGTIAEVRHELPGALVRVRTGNNVTDWRPYHELRAGNTRTWNPPTVGEQVTLLSPGGDLAGALVIGGIHQNDHPAPSTDPNKTPSPSTWTAPPSATTTPRMPWPSRCPAAARPTSPSPTASLSIARRPT